MWLLNQSEVLVISAQTGSLKQIPASIDAKFATEILRYTSIFTLSTSVAQTKLCQGGQKRTFMCLSLPFQWRWLAGTPVSQVIIFFGKYIFGF